MNQRKQLQNQAALPTTVRLRLRRLEAADVRWHSMKKWNPETGRYEPFAPGDRTYPPLPQTLALQASRIPTTTYGGLTHCPCSAVLVDGQTVDCVCLADAAPYIKCWGVWPDQDKGKREIRIQDVARIEVCQLALPTIHAQRLNDAGESGMGYMIFEIEYRDGSRTAHLSGCVVNFARIPEGKTMADVVAVHPHAGRNSRLIAPPTFSWCLYGKE